MKIYAYIICCVLLFIFLSCDKIITEPQDKNNNTEAENEYWTIPEEDAVVLFFRMSDSIRVDSLKAGQIQFRFDEARTVCNEIAEFSVGKEWELGKILLRTTDELYTNFDTTTYRFNYEPLDSLLNVYELCFGYKRFNLIRLIFPKYYNIPILSQLFENMNGVIYADPNLYATLGICDEDVTLEIIGELYKFIFSLTGSCSSHFWEVHVINDQAELIVEWH